MLFDLSRSYIFKKMAWEAWAQGKGKMRIGDSKHFRARTQQAKARLKTCRKGRIR